MKEGDRVIVTGPAGSPEVTGPMGKKRGAVPPSAQLGKFGVVVSVGEVIAVLLDGETRPRNFKPADLGVA